MLIERDQRDDQPCLLDLHAVSLAAVDTTTRGDQKQLTRQNKLPLTAAENVCGEGGGGRGEEGGPIKGCRRVGGQEVPQRAANDDEPSRRREGCHFADTPFPSMLKHLLEGEGGAAEWQSRRRLGAPDDTEHQRPRHTTLEPDLSAEASERGTKETAHPVWSACVPSLWLREGRRTVASGARSSRQGD